MNKFFVGLVALYIVCVGVVSADSVDVKTEINVTLTDTGLYIETEGDDLNLSRGVNSTLTTVMTIEFSRNESMVSYHENWTFCEESKQRVVDNLARCNGRLINASDIKEEIGSIVAEFSGWRNMSSNIEICENDVDSYRQRYLECNTSKDEAVKKRTWWTVIIVSLIWLAWMNKDKIKSPLAGFGQGEGKPPTSFGFGD
jgi:hypothetical protein